MISIRTLTPVFLLATTLAVAQTAPPAPPSPPAPLPAPAAAPAAPGQGMHMLLGPADLDLSGLTDQIQEQIGKLDLEDLKDRIKDQMKDFKFEMKDFDWDQAAWAKDQAQWAKEQGEWAKDLSEQAKAFAKDQAWAFAGQNWNAPKGFAFTPQTPMPTPPTPPMPAMPPQPKVTTGMIRRGMSPDSLYERGLSALDSHRYDQALEFFTEVATRGGTHAEGALYWKAYALNKLGRRDDATAALAELRKTFPSSRWLDDAKALEIEVKQSSGQRVSPESESNDDLKLLALEGLVQSDPDRAFPHLETLLKGPQPPSLKKRAIYVLALSNSPRAQQLLVQIARGGTGNPDLQMTAIQYLGRNGKDTNKSNILFEIYNSSPDANVKRAVIREMGSNRDKDHLMQIAKSDKSVDMREEAIRYVAGPSTAQDMWALYQSESDPEVRRAILDYVSGSTDKLIEIVKTEKDPKLRRSAIQHLGSVKAASASDTLVQIYGTEQDQQVKRAIIDTLAAERQAKPMIDIFHKETDPEMKKAIVRRMLDLKTPEVNQILEEILK